MDARFTAVMQHYHDRMAREAEEWRRCAPADLMRRRDEFLLPVGEAVAWVLYRLIIARGPGRIVELGTSYGYSTLFLAAAAQASGGRLITFEISGEKQAYARRQIEAAGLADVVEWRLGDAVTLLDDLEGPIDFVLLDLWKDLYIPCLERFFPKLADNAVIAADNMLEPKISRPDAALYRAAVKAKPGIQSVLLPIGKGVELSCLWKDTV